MANTAEGLDVATKLGVNVASEAIKSAIGI